MTDKKVGERERAYMRRQFTLEPPSPGAMTERAVAVLWALVPVLRDQRDLLLDAAEQAEKERDEARAALSQVRAQFDQFRAESVKALGETPALARAEAAEARVAELSGLLKGREARVAELFGLLKDRVRERDAAEARVRDLERDRDLARAEVETLRLGRDELEKMRAATVAELEATRRLLGRITPDPRETGLLEERRELLARGVVPFDVSPCGVAGHRGVCRCDLGSSIPRGVVLEWAARLDAEIVMWSPALRAIVEEMARRGRQ